MDDIKSKIVKLLTPYADEMEDARLGKYLTLSVGRVLMNDKSNSSISSLVNKEDLRHITDWLKSSIINNVSWISNIDAENRPKKLMKFSSIEQMIKEADKAMLKATQRLSDVKLVDGDEALFTKLNNGYYIVSLLTPAALDRESSTMQHCIGEGAYDKTLLNNDYLYLSLRDPAGKPHATLEICRDKVLQFQGKQNKLALDKYQQMILPLITAHKWKIDGLEKFNYIFSASDNSWHNIYNLPDGSIIEGAILYPEGIPVVLPKNLTMNGDIYLDGLKNVELSDNMKVNNLDLQNSKINFLPKGLHVNSMLNLNNTQIKVLPEDLYVGNYLFIEKSQIEIIPTNIKKLNILIADDTPLKSLPNNFNVGELLLRNTRNLTSLPYDIRISGSLFLNNSSITHLPKGLNISQLEIDCTDIQDIPEGTKVTKNLIISNTKIKTLPDSIAGVVSLWANNCALEELNPDIAKNLRIDLSLQNSQMKSLPNGLKIQFLDISNSAIEKLPDDIKISNKLFIGGTNITELSKGIQRLTEVRAANSKLERLNDNLYINKLILTNTPISELPKGLHVIELNIVGTGITRLPEDLKASIIICADYQIDNVPEYLVEQNTQFKINGKLVDAQAYKIICQEYTNNRNNMPSIQ